MGAGEGDGAAASQPEIQAAIEAFQEGVKKALGPGDAARAAESAANERAWYERVQRETYIAHLKTVNRRWRHDMRLRAKYASRAFALAGWAVWFWIIMFAAVGIGNAASGRQILSDTALITLTTGATVNVVAVFVVVIRGLFPAKDAPPDVRSPPG